MITNTYHRPEKLEETLPDNSNHQAPSSSETQLEEKLMTSGFCDLFAFEPEDVKPEFREVLRLAPIEISNCLYENLELQKRALDEKSEKSNPLIHRIREKAYSSALRSMEFFNSFCTDLCGRSDYMVEIEYDRRFNEISLFFLLPRGESWGAMGLEEVDEVQIDIRMGSENGIQENTYTPMQLNFRFVSNGNDGRHEIDSWRLDMHNNTNRSIELDARVGQREFEVHHRKIAAINNTGDPQQNFRAFQSLFLINIARRFLLDTDSEEPVAGMPLKKVPEKMKKRLIAILNNSESYLHT